MLPEFTLATSEVSFETAAGGVLPRSIMIIGKTYTFKEYIKDRFPEVRYLDLIFNGGSVTKAAWVLPVTAETTARGTLAALLTSLGARVIEVDLDEDMDEDDDAERDDEDLIDGEAEEAEDDEDDDDA